MLMTFRILVLVKKEEGSKFTKSLWRKENLLFSVFILLTLFAAFRGLTVSVIPLRDALASLVYFVAVFLVCLNYFGISRQPLSLNERIYYIAIGFSLYVAVNFVLYQLDILIKYIPEADADSGSNLLLQSIGIDMNRALFPMAYGINAYGNVAGLGLFFSIYLYRVAKNIPIKIISCIFILISIYSILMVESRGVFLGVIFAVLFSPFAKGVFAKIIVFSTPLIPVIIFFSIFILKEIGVLSLFTRGDSDFSGLVTDRDVIWAVSISDLSKFEFIHLFGFGLYGNAASGLMEKYSWLFDYYKTTFHTLHNVGLQYVLDIGYIGVLVYLIVVSGFFQRINKMKTLSQATAWILKSAMLFLIALGGTESIPSLYATESFFIFMFFIFLAYSKELNQLNNHQLKLVGSREVQGTKVHPLRASRQR
ncbi:hypothetical protein [Polaromonas sp.]|uniref:hypothetical protein n=1 Tax=Polaromonas sp. TaxID=1869339 RepID=UPI003BB7E00E